MSDRLKEQAIEAGYGNGIGSQLLARIDELEAELATIKARTCKTCSKWYDEYPGSATCAEWSVYSSPSDPQCGENHYAKTRGDGFCYMWVAKKEGK